MPQSGKLSVFTHMPKISIFAPKGRLAKPIDVNFGTSEGYFVRLGRAKFQANRCPGVGTRPKMAKISTFW